MYTLLLFFLPKNADAAAFNQFFNVKVLHLLCSSDFSRHFYIHKITCKLFLQYLYACSNNCCEISNYILYIPRKTFEHKVLNIFLYFFQAISPICKSYNTCISNPRRITNVKTSSFLTMIVCIGICINMNTSHY